MIVEKVLGQIRPSDTNPVSLYSPGANKSIIIKSVYVCNTSGIAATFRIFLDDNGTTYDESTALFWDTSIGPDTTVELDTFISMNDQTGNLGVRSSNANALTFTAFGAEITQ